MTKCAQVQHDNTTVKKIVITIHTPVHNLNLKEEICVKSMFLLHIPETEETLVQWWTLRLDPGTEEVWAGVGGVCEGMASVGGVCERVWLG